MEQHEVRDILTELRREVIIAVNKLDNISYMHYVQEILIGATLLEDEEERKELGIFVHDMEKTFRQFRGAK